MGKQRDEQEVYSRDVGLDTIFYYDANKRQEYVLRAYPGTATTAAAWQIYKLSYNSDGTQFKRRYAGATDAFINIATNYASLNYTDI